MPIEPQTNPILSPPPRGVDIDKIEKELASMWSSTGCNEPETESTGMTRACALNLIVYTTPEEDREQLEEQLGQVNEHHPGRVLILVASHDTAEAGLQGYVSMRCRARGGDGKQICGEQVTIEARGAMVDTAATAIAPLLVPDVPVYLWWKDIPHYEDKLFDRLSRLADRLVIDSSAFDHPYDDLLRLTGMIGDKSRRLLASDLNWGRLTSWRSLLANFWDVPAYRPLLDKIDHVTIEYRASSEAPDEVVPAALLLAAWLSARLRWDVVDSQVRVNEGTVECDLRADDRTIVLSLVRDKTAESNDRMISSVTVAVETAAAAFSVALRADGSRLETEAKIGTEHCVGRLMGYERRSDAERLSRELAFLSRDFTYEEAMTHAARLIQTISRQHV